MDAPRSDLAPRKIPYASLTNATIYKLPTYIHIYMYVRKFYLPFPKTLLSFSVSFYYIYKLEHKLKKTVFLNSTIFFHFSTIRFSKYFFSNSFFLKKKNFLGHIWLALMEPTGPCFIHVLTQIMLHLVNQLLILRGQPCFL